MILVIDNYDSFTWNLVQLIGALGCDPRVVRNDAHTVGEIVLMRPQAIVISPGPGRPEQAGVSVGVVRQLGARVPILGVCLGHQAIVTALGGRVAASGRPMHGKTSQVVHRGRGLFAGLPNPMTVGRYHSLVADPESLPDDLTIEATASDGAVMAVAHARWPVWGVQFHPESILTPDGPKLLERFLALASLAGEPAGGAAVAYSRRD